MQDLHIINKTNAEAVLKAVPALVAAGKFVVVEYNGLNYIDTYSFDTEHERNARAIEITDKPGHRTELFQPSV